MPATPNPSCQVDFYVLKKAGSKVSRQACKLALMAWEQGQKTFVVCASAEDVQTLDRLMWEHPPGRFLPHSAADGEHAARAAVIIGRLGDLNLTDVVINLGPEPIPQPERFRRVLEFVPFDKDERDASRTKYKHYRDLGLTPRTNEIGTPPR